jgi:NTE family protein
MPECVHVRTPVENQPDLALMLAGGGARAAYQVGFLHVLAEEFPDLMPGILTGVSAGAVNAAYLAVHEGCFRCKVASLTTLWRDLRIDDVFSVDPHSLTTRVFRWGLRLLSGGSPGAPRVRSLVDTAPLERLLERVLNADNGALPGIAKNLREGMVRAVALTASSYTTGQSITWVQGPEIPAWRRPLRASANCTLTVRHVMASSALPFLFPAVDVDGAWYGDGGVRLTAPLSPAIHLGARRIIAISTRSAPPTGLPPRNGTSDYPPPAVVVGALFDAIFLDQLDADAERTLSINKLIAKLAAHERDGLRHIDLLVLRPSQDLGVIANDFEPKLPPTFRFLTRGLGTQETRRNHMLSLMMFQPDYLARLLELGEADARARALDIRRFLTEPYER